MHGNKIYHVLKIRYIAISGGIFLDAARWRLLDFCGDKAFRMTTTTAHALLPLVSGTVVFPMDLRSIHTSRLEELYEIWYPDSEKPPRAHYSSHKRIMRMEHKDEAVQLTGR